MELSNLAIISQRRSGSSAYADFLARSIGGLNAGESLFLHKALKRSCDTPIFTCTPSVFKNFLNLYYSAQFNGVPSITKFPVIQWHPSVYPAYVEFMIENDYQLYFTMRNIRGRLISQIMRLGNHTKYTYLADEDTGIEWIAPDPTSSAVTKASLYVLQEEYHSNTMMELLSPYMSNVSIVNYETDILPIGDEISTKYAVLHDKYPHIDVEPYYIMMDYLDTPESLSRYVDKHLYDCTPYMKYLIRNQVKLLAYNEETNTIDCNPNETPFVKAIMEQYL